jgi:hypothetical protein
MAIKEAKKAIRKRLLALSPTYPTAYEGISFITPNSMYQRLQFLISSPTDPVFGRGYYRENIEVQIFIADLQDNGTTPAEVRAEEVRDWFHKGLTLTEDGIRMHVLRTPQVSSATVVADRIIVPVLIPLTVEIYEQ